MRLSDVVVGEEYEYKGYAGSYKGHKATVLQVGVDLDRYNFKGVLVLIDEIRMQIEKAVPARTLHRLWKDAEAEYKRKEARQLAEQRNRDALLVVRPEIEVEIERLVPDARVRFSRVGAGSISIRLLDQKSATTILDILRGAE